MTSTRTNEQDLFDNDMVHAASAAMSSEQKRRYLDLGNELFTSMESANTPRGGGADPNHIADAILYVTEQVKAGLHISMLDKDEKNLMVNVYGREWYKRWGYTARDVDEMATYRLHEPSEGESRAT